MQFAQVLLSLLTSFVVELIKERKTIHKLVYPHQHSSLEYEGQNSSGVPKDYFFTFSLFSCLDINDLVVSDRLGMPPMYMVVDIRWDDYAPEDEIVQMQDPTKDIFQNNNALPISPSRKRWALLRKSKLSIPIDSLYQNHNLLKTHQRFYLDDQVANFILKL